MNKNLNISRCLFGFLFLLFLFFPLAGKAQDELKRPTPPMGVEEEAPPPALPAPSDTEAAPPSPDMESPLPGDEAQEAHPRDSLADLAQRVAKLEALARELERTTGQTVNTLESVARRLESFQKQLDSINEKLEQIAESDGSETVPSILSNMRRNASFRRQMSDVVQGRLLVVNNTGAPQSLYINGVLWRVPVGESSTRVPFGNVTTQLVPWEPPRDWTAENWNYVNGEPRLRLGIQY